MFNKTLLIALTVIGLSYGKPNTTPRRGWIGAAANPFLPVDPYIVGGEIVEGREFPSQISLQVYDSHNCGGSILNSEWILTAGHCSGYSPSDLTVVEGSNLLSSGGVQHKVVEIKVHEKYDAYDSWINDIAVMKVSPPIEFREGVSAVKLPKKGQETPAGSKATVVGWGRLSAGGPIPNELRKVDVEIADHEKCNKAYSGDSSAVRDTQICAGTEEGGKDACNGDSGGPLFVNNEIIGIVSWGRPCAQKGYPTVYTEVSDYIDWIEEHIKVECRDLNNSVRHVKLPENDEEIEDDAVLSVAGWGAPRGEPPPKKLRSHTVKIKDHDQCKTEYESIFLINENHLYVESTQSVDIALKGNSGGPLIYGDEIHGVISAGKSNKYFICTKVKKFIQWILETKRDF